MNNILVSIICNTYNHEKFIARALDSFLKQKCDFNFEVLVHDDASTDRTAEIIKEYEVRFPDIVKPIYQEENLYSKKVNINVKFQYPRARGKYIAICEGDDFWTDENKIQTQFDILEKYPNINMSAHKSVLVNALTQEKVGNVTPAGSTRILKPWKVILGGGGYLATSSLFYRAYLNDNLPNFRKMLSLDYTMQIYGSFEVGIFYIDKCMSAYQIETPDSWTEKSKCNFKFKHNHNIMVRKMFKQLNKDTNNKYILPIFVVYLRAMCKDIYYRIMEGKRK